MKIPSKELIELLSKKTVLIDEARGYSKEIETLEETRRKVGLQVQKIKDKVIPLVKKLTDGKLAEFEEITQVDIKDGEIDITVVNVVEDFKRDYLEAKKKAEIK